MAGYTNGYNPTNAGYGRYAPNSMYANNQNFSPTPYSNNYLNNFQSPYNNYLNNGIQATQQPLQISTTYVTSVEEARAMIQNDKIEFLRDQLTQERLVNSQCAQNAQLINALRPYPQPTYLTCNPSAQAYGAYNGFGGSGYGYGCC